MYSIDFKLNFTFYKFLYSLAIDKTMYIPLETGFHNRGECCNVMFVTCGGGGVVVISDGCKM